MPHPYNYRLYRYILLLFFFPLLSASATSTGLKKGFAYNYSLEAVKSAVTAPVTTFALAAPTVQARPSLVGANTVKWTPVSGATGYILEKSNTGEASTFVTVKTFSASDTHFRHTGLYYNQKVFYRIKAVGTGEESPYSTVVSATTNSQGKTYRIMPLGDSNTEGGSGTVPTDEKASYRAKLEELLDATASNGRYDFVGSEQTGEKYLNDLDHAGMGAARNQDLVTLIRNGYYKRWYDQRHMGLDYSANYLEVFTPDIILLHIGTNDISNEGVDNSDATINDLTTVLNEIDKYEVSSGREVTVVLAKIIKSVCNGEDCFKSAAGTKNDIIELYNNKMQNLANKRIAQGDRIELVDMADAGIVYDYVHAGGDMADRLHPLMSGFDKMAKVWFNVVDKLLNVQLQAPDTQAPETSFTSKPAELTNKNSADFGFSSNESDVRYQVSLDGAQFSDVTTPYTLSGLADGVHTIKVRAIDTADNIDPTPATYTWTIDTKAPVAPVVMAPAEGDLLNTNKPTISGTAEPEATVKVFKGSSQVGSATAAANGNWSFIPGTAFAEGGHEIIAKATDAAGNTSAASTGRSFTIDTKAPETTIVSNPPAATNSKTASFSFESNEEGVAYLVSLDGAAFAEITNPATLNRLSDGKHTLQVKAIDAAGNTDASPATYTWMIDTTPPAAPVILAITEDRGPEKDDQVTSDNTLKLKGTAEADATITVALTGKGTIGTVEADGSGDWVYNYEGTALASGTHTFTATAADALGNTSAAGNTFKVTIDQTAPTATLTTAITSPVSGSFDISISFSEAVFGLTEADFDIENGKIGDLKSTGDATFTATITPSKNGEVTVQLPASKVTDLAGNDNIASGMLKVTNDEIRPEILLSTQAQETINSAFEVTVSFSEAVSGFELNDVTVANGKASDLRKTNDQVYTLVITGTAQGEVAVSIAADKTNDAAGNGNEASNVLKRKLDSVAPTGYAVAFGVTQVNIKNEHNISATISEAEKGATYTYTITSNNGGTPVTGTGSVNSESVKITSLDLSGLNDGTLTLTLYLTDEVGNKGEAVTATVAKVTKDVKVVIASGLVRVPFDTDFSEVQLSQKVKVVYSNGEEGYLDVTWQQGNYNQKVPGKYTITGILTLAANTTNFDNKTGSIIIEVAPNQPPTALTLSTTRFKPNAAPTDVLGTFSTEDPEDETFTYTLVSGDGDDHNRYFQIINDELHLPSNNGLSGITNFRIRVQSTDPYKNTIERTFILTKSVYEPQQKIKLVNAFSPDGDGINDKWTVPELRFYNEVEITVMDRSGARLYHTTDPEKGWDGRGRNGEIEQGAYFYIIQVKDTGLVQKGVVTVLK